MNLVSIAFGLLFIAISVRTLVARFRDPSAHDTVAGLKKPAGENAQAIGSFVTGLVVPIVTPLAIGIAFVTVGLMGRALAPFSWFGW